MTRPIAPRTPAAPGRGYLNGHLLISMPSIFEGPFARTVVYVCAHSADGAMGLTINKPAPQISFRSLLVQLGVIPDTDAIELPHSIEDMQVQRGGPVETGRGFVLHSADYFIDNATLPIDEHVSLTATLEILKAIANGSGPESALLALGYAGWSPGQLDSEIHANGWLHCPAVPDLVFDRDLDAKYDRALQLLGVDLGMLSSEAGHA